MALQESIEKFLNHFEQLKVCDDKDVDGFSKEFKKLILKSRKNITDQKFPVTHGENPGNISKNRYKDILPYDHSRVVLSERDGRPGSDYINANFIYGATGHKTYIAAQGPMPGTVEDFWRMLWEYRTHCVVMACNEYEGIKHKCQRYWPLKDEELCFYGIVVTLVEEQKYNEYRVRIIQAKVDDEVRLVYQFHYCTWPDHGTPTNMGSILDMIALVRQYQKQDVPPLVVHCSAGCGRTGTILAIDYTWSLLKLGKLDLNFDLYKMIARFRTQRQSLVQAEDQYVFVYMAVQELFQRHLNLLEDHLYENVLNIVIPKNDNEEEKAENSDSSEEELYQTMGNPRPDQQSNVMHTPLVVNTTQQQPANNNSLDSPPQPPVTSTSQHSLSSSSTSSSVTSPPPPPKPNRIFSTDESPANAVIFETVQRFMSTSDIEDESTQPVFKLKDPVPRKQKNSLTKVNTQNAAGSAEKEVKPSKPAVPPQKPSIGKKPVSSSDSKTNEKQDGEVLTGALEVLDKASKTRKEQRSNYENITVERGAEGPNLKVNVPTTEKISPRLMRKALPDYENIINAKDEERKRIDPPSVVSKPTIPKNKPKLTNHEEGDKVRKNSESNSVKNLPPPISPKKPKECQDTNYEEGDKVRRNSESNSVKNLPPPISTKKPKECQDGKKHTGAQKRHQYENIKNSDTNDSGESSAFRKSLPTNQHKPTTKSSDSDALPEYLDIIGVESNQSENKPIAPAPRKGRKPSNTDSPSDHKVLIDINSETDQVVISNSKEQSQLKQQNSYVEEINPEYETCSDLQVSVQTTNNNKPSKQKWSYTRSDPVYQDIECDEMNESAPAAAATADDEELDTYMYITSGKQTASLEKRQSGKSSMSSISSNDVFTPQSYGYPVDSDYSSDDDPVYRPEVPKKNFAIDDSELDAREIQFITKEEQRSLQELARGNQDVSAAKNSKTFGRKMGRQLQKFKHTNFLKGLGSGGSAGATSKLVVHPMKPAAVVFKNKDISFGNTVEKPKGPTAEGQGWRNAIKK